MKKLRGKKYFLCMLAITCTQSFVASDQDMIEVQDLLVESPAPINKFVTTPLHALVVTHFDDKNEKLHKIQELIDSGADVNAQDEDRRTPLWLVTFKGGDIEIINLLIKNGADITIPDVFNVTPLHNVVTRNDTVAASLLLDTAAMMKSHTVEKMIAFKNDAEQSPLTIVKTPEMDETLLIAEDESLALK